MRSSTNGWGNSEICRVILCCPIATHGSCYCALSLSAKRREVPALSLSDLEGAEVLAFLQHLENDRKVSIGTRNCRLAAIHSFFAFVARREPLALVQCAEIARIPVK